MNPKPIIIATCCAIAIVVGVYLFGRYTLEKNRPDDIPITSNEKISIPAIEDNPELGAKEHSNGDVGDFKLEDFPATLDEFEALPDAKIEELGRIFRALPQKKQDEISRRIWESKGLDPPPVGHAYYEINGKIRLVKFGAPMIEIQWSHNYGNLHQLSDTEWEEYKALVEIADGTIQSEWGFTQDMIPIAEEWRDKLWKKTWGPYPTISATTISLGVATETDWDRQSKIIGEKYESLFLPERDRTIDYTVVTQLINKIKAELERR